MKIGVALDEAFNFYYADLSISCIPWGAEYIPFSPVHDRLPEADGYIIGGGYPELFVSELEANDPHAGGDCGKSPKTDHHSMRSAAG